MFTDFEGKKPRGLFFFSGSQTHRETSELRNSLGRPRKFPKIFGNSRSIFGNSGTKQDKISRLWLRKFWQVYQMNFLKICALENGAFLQF